MRNFSFYKSIITISILMYFSPLHSQVTSWVTKPAGIDIPDANDLSSRISDDGQYIAFLSASSNLVESDTNLRSDVFLTSPQNNSITRITSNGNEYQDGLDLYSKPAANGTKIAIGRVDKTFAVDPFLGIKNLTTGLVTVQKYNSGADNIKATSNEIFLSDDGRYLIFKLKMQSYLMTLIQQETFIEKIY